MSETAVNGVEPIIFLDDVHVTFRTRTGSILHPNLVHAVQGVTIKLMPGQTIGIVGESGCGKSTTANVMCGLQAPTSGKVYFKGKDVTKRTAEDRRHMGRVISVVFQNPATALNPRMVVREQLLDPMRVHNLGTEAEQEKRVKELLELTGLPSSAAEVLPGQLSGGQRQRVAIARALSLNPDAIIADEPTSALDVSVRAQVLNLLVDLKEELGLGLVFTLRAMDAHGMIGMHVHPGRVLVNAAALVFEAFVLLADTPLYGLWTGIITALIILYNFSGVWAMARILLPKILGRRGKALVAVVDGWAAKK